MNAFANGSRSDVTVLLLGQDESAYRARATHFYRQAGVPCHPLEPLRSDSGSETCNGRLALALQEVETPWVVLAMDADFVIPDALDRSAAALHAGAALVQGYPLAYAAGNLQVQYRKAGSVAAAATSEGAFARLRQCASAAQQAWRAVMPVQVLEAALLAIPAGLDLAGWQVALSWVLVQGHAIERIDGVDVVAEYAPCSRSAAAREERLTTTVRTLWQDGPALSQMQGEEAGFELLNRFVRALYTPQEQSLLFTSSWKGIVHPPERLFEPRQFVELPYYNQPLFSLLAELEFLCHAWPAGQRQFHALEGAWVRQQQLLQTPPNDTAETEQLRLWEAFALGMFNREVCKRLIATLSADRKVLIAEMSAWLLKLAEVPEQGQELAETVSGQVLASLARATPDSEARAGIVARLEQAATPQVAFVVLDLADDDSALQTTLDSVLDSGLRNFKLLVLKAGKPPAVTTARDTLHFVRVNTDNWVAHLNQALRQLSAEWLMQLDAGERLLPGGLLHLLGELNNAGGCDAICCDEVQSDEGGRLLAVVRPGADLDLLRSQPALMSRHWLVRRQALLDLGGFTEGQAVAAEFDLLLRLVEARGVASLGHLDDYLVLGATSAEALTQQGKVVLERHLRRLGYRAQVDLHSAGGLQVHLRHEATPLVSILLASEEGLGALQACLTSVLQKTRYPRYEVLVACAGLAGEAQGQGGLGSRVRLVAGDAGASRDELLGRAAEQARGEFLVLLAEDGEVVNPAWLEGLLNEAQRPEVGVVGGALQGLDGRLLHTGYTLLEGPQVDPSRIGDEVRWRHSVRSVDAVSGGCLMLSKALYLKGEGLPAPQAADIGLCLLARQAGLMVVWTPAAQIQRAQHPLFEQQALLGLAERWPHAFSARAKTLQATPWWVEG